MDISLIKWLIDYSARKISFWKDAISICENKGVSEGIAFLTTHYILTKLFLE
jgi:hypothetical protein